MFPTPEIWGVPMYVRGVRVCQGVRVHVPLGPLGVSGNGARGPCTRQGTDSAPFGMFPTPECWGVSMYVRGRRACRAVTVYTSFGRPCGKAVCGPLPFQV